ncbi:MAG: hypothetical protein NT038_00545 [Euryarchaeota archaeon]|nr:hypothetical protein [Euryarchaeota archaeon]
MVIMDSTLQELRLRYPFLRFVTIEKTLYSEGANAIHILPGIDSIESKDVYKAISEYIKITVKHLEKNADFFFIKEVKEAISDIDEIVFDEGQINLNFMQFEYLAERQQELKIQNSEITEQILKSLIYVINKKYPEIKTMQIVIDAIKKLTKPYDFLSFIEIHNQPDSQGFFVIRALLDINNVHILTLGQAMQNLIEEVGKASEWESNQTFIDQFKTELGEPQLENLNKMGINLNHIQVVLLRREHSHIVKKTLETLLMIITNRKSKDFAVTTLCSALHELEQKHEVLQLISINTSEKNIGNDIIQVMSEINDAESYKLGQAIREVIKFSGKKLEDKTGAFIEDFKHQLGDDYLNEIEKIGVNLHFLELKFQS